MAIDTQLMDQVVSLATEAGDRLLAVFDPDARPANRGELMRVAIRNEHVSGDELSEALLALRPGARIVEDEQETTPLPDDGEWWVVDNAEGSVNHVHGMAEWGVSIALIVANVTELAVFREPVADLTYTVVRGGGAWLNGKRLRVSDKHGLEIALLSTGQAEANQPETYGRIGRSITALLEAGFLVRATVPSTFPMLLVAAGHLDAFWQYEPVLPGVATGALLVSEAGGIVSAIGGEPWQPGADSILVAAPGVYEDVRNALGAVG